MYRFFDKHGKKILAIASALLMVAFLLPTTATHWMQGGFGGGGSGKLNGKSLDRNEVDQAYNVLLSLESLVMQNPQVPGGWMPVGNIIFQGHYNQLLQDRVTWYLLMHEANQAGVVTDESQINSIINSGMVYLMDANATKPLKLSEVNPAVRENYASALRQALTVVDSFSRSQRTIKVSRPLVNDELAARTQRVRSHIALFNVDDFASAVTAPTEEELRVQFEAFASIIPGSFDPKTNPFGFGYRIPDRVRLQYLAVPEKEIEASVIKSKSPELWEEDARIYYSNNMKKFEVTPAIEPPATQPSTQPFVPVFEAIAEKVAHEVRKPLIEQKRRVIVNRISQQLTTDYQRASKNLSAKPEETADAIVGSTKLGSFDYLLRLRDDIQRQFGVTITVVNEAELIGQQALRDRGGLGSANVEDNSPEARSLASGAAYLFSSVESFLPKDSQDTSTVTPLHLYQPSKAMVGGEQTYIARVVQAEVSHAPIALVEVKDQVEKDTRRKQAFAKAIEAAEAAVKKAETSGFASIDKPAVVTTDWFGMPQEIQPGFTLPMPIEGTPKEWDAFSAQLVKPIFDLQRGLASTKDLPRRDVVKLQRAGKVAAVELFEIKTVITAPDEMLAKAQMGQIVAQSLVPRNAANEWYGSKSVNKRVGYVPPAEDAKPDSSKPEAPRPKSPFMPG